MIRTFKIALAMFIALFCLTYAAQNLMNLQSAHGFVGLMTSMADHVAYPNHIGPPIKSPAVVWVFLFVIIAAELLAGLLGGKGAWDMWKARNSDADTFNSAKTYAMAACGVAILLWFGVFSAVGGAYFQMWQTTAGETPLMHASTFSIQYGVFFLIFALKDK